MTDKADMIDNYRHDFLGAMGALTVGFATQLQLFADIPPHEAAHIVTEWLTESAEAHAIEAGKRVQSDAKAAAAN